MSETDICCGTGNIFLDFERHTISTERDNERKKNFQKKRKHVDTVLRGLFVHFLFPLPVLLRPFGFCKRHLLATLRSRGFCNNRLLVLSVGEYWQNSDQQPNQFFLANFGTETGKKK